MGYLLVRKQPTAVLRIEPLPCGHPFQDDGDEDGEHPCRACGMETLRKLYSRNPEMLEQFERTLEMLDVLESELTEKSIQ